MHRDVAPDRRFQRSQTEHEHFLFEGIEYPTNKEELVAFATDAIHDTDTLNLVRALPDREYFDRDDIWRAMGEASRRFGLGHDDGAQRDDIGKQWTVTEEGVRQP